MRITLSTKRLYDSDQMNQILSYYNQLHYFLSQIRSIERGDISKDSLDGEYKKGTHVKTVRRFIQIFRDGGLKDIREGENLCNELENKLKEVFPELDSS